MRRHAPKFQGHDGACPSKNVSISILCLAFLAAYLTGCTTSRHQFSEPARDWQTRNGQLLYRNAKTTIIGDVLVRFSTNGGFELTFSKGPGVTLLTIQQDTSFARATGGLTRGGWSGPVGRAPAQLRGWLSLREKLINTPNRQSIRHVVGAETFLFRF